MPIKEIEISDFSDFYNELRKLSRTKQFIFRGQRNYNHKLTTTLNRYYNDFDEQRLYTYYNIDYFIANISKITSIKHDLKNKLECLEYGRHYGLPTPFIDFSYSPFVALFFAFNEMDAIDDNYSSLYALNHIHLAMQYANEKANGDKSLIQKYYLTFLFDLDKTSIFNVIENKNIDLFPFYNDDGTFPLNILKYFPHPKHDNDRMIRQQGCFIYDTFNYSAMKHQTFEDYINSLEDIDGPTLIKFKIKHKFIDSVFELLEDMNINGSLLFMDPTGAANDVKNARFYIPKAMRVKD